VSKGGQLNSTQTNARLNQTPIPPLLTRRLLLWQTSFLLHDLSLSILEIEWF